MDLMNTLELPNMAQDIEHPQADITKIDYTLYLTPKHKFQTTINGMQPLLRIKDKEQKDLHHMV